MVIALSDMKVTEELARPAHYAPILNVLIAVSAVKTPNVFSIQIALRHVHASQATGEMDMVLMDVFTLG